jgi:hypothetical protein
MSQMKSTDIYRKSSPTFMEIEEELSENSDEFDSPYR